MNVAVTLSLGVYGVIDALYSEGLKQGYERRGDLIAVDFFLCLILLTGAISLFRLAYRHIKDDRA